MNIPFFSQIIADNSAAASVDSIANSATEPLDLTSFDFQALGAKWFDAICNFGLRVIIAIVVFFIGRWLIKKILHYIDKLLKKRAVSGLAISLLNSVFSALLYIALVMVIVGLFGVTSTSFAAILASMGLAVGMALSGQLQNLAGGIIILVTRPFSVGEFVEAQDVMGTVVDITLFHTMLRTIDNKLIFVPNGSLSSGVISNYSCEALRRVDFTIGVEYGEDFEKVKTLLLELAKADSRIKTNPEPLVFLSELADSSVNISYRIWTESSLYWDVYFDFNAKVYAEFNKAGIGFPFPQLTIHKAEN